MRHRILFRIAGSIALLAASLPAVAAQRVFVSAMSGNDANATANCAPTLPCRSFATALSKVDGGGEIIVLDSGAYGVASIDKSVALLAPDGVYAGISVFSGNNGLTINAPGARVTLRGLSINGLGGNHGIEIQSAAQVSIESCAIKNMAGSGVVTQSGGKVRVLDSLIEKNDTGVAIYGVAARALISNTKMLANVDYGLRVTAADGEMSRVEVVRSAMSGSAGGAGFFAEAVNSGTARVNIWNSTIAQNGTGGWVYIASPGAGTAVASVSDSLIADNGGCGILSQGAGAMALASANRVLRNGTGLCQQSGASFWTASDNTVRDNTYNLSGTISKDAAVW